MIFLHILTENWIIYELEHEGEMGLNLKGTRQGSNSSTSTSLQIFMTFSILLTTFQCTLEFKFIFRDIHYIFLYSLQVLTEHGILEPARQTGFKLQLQYFRELWLSTYVPSLHFNFSICEIEMMIYNNPWLETIWEQLICWVKMIYRICKTQCGFLSSL